MTVVPISLDSEFAKWQLLKRFVGTGLRHPRDLRNRQPPPRLVISKYLDRNQAAIQKCRRFGTPFFWLKDVYSIGVKSVLSRYAIGDLIASRYALAGSKVARQSDGIIAIGTNFATLRSIGDPDAMS